MSRPLKPPANTPGRATAAGVRAHRWRRRWRCRGLAPVRGHFTNLGKWLQRLFELGAEQGALHPEASPEIDAQAFMATVYGAMLAARAFDDPAVQRDCRNAFSSHSHLTPTAAWRRAPVRLASRAASRARQIQLFDRLSYAEPFLADFASSCSRSTSSLPPAIRLSSWSRVISPLA